MLVRWQSELYVCGGGGWSVVCIAPAGCDSLSDDSECLDYGPAFTFGCRGTSVFGLLTGESMLCFLEMVYAV